MPCRTATRHPLESLLWQGISHHLRHTTTVKLFADPHAAHFAVTAYGDDHVAIDGRALRRSLLLLPDRIDEDWGPANFAMLTHEHLAPLAVLACDVLLLGTGVKQHFLPPALMHPLIEAGRSIEVMGTQAACRTYNILVAEGRVVAAALIIEENETRLSQ